MAEPDSRTGRRRPGRGAIVDAALARFAEASLEQVVGAVAGVRDLAAAAGVAPATVNHHFPPGGDRRNTRLAEAALGHALGCDGEGASVARHLAVAVAPRSVPAAGLLRSRHAEAHESVVAALEVRLAADGLQPCPGISTDGLAIVLGALTDGLRTLARYEPGIDTAIDGLVDLVLARCTDPAAG